MNTREAIDSLNEEGSKLLGMVIEGSDAVGVKKVWQRDIEPSRHASMTQEAIDTLIDLALVTKESVQGERYYKLHITVKAAEAVGLYWNKHDEWAQREA
tara:strand:- start:588 stop:884 length:297 start_codon:yes stop_codon:yes gene_type:complete